MYKNKKRNILLGIVIGVVILIAAVCIYNKAVKQATEPTIDYGPIEEATTEELEQYNNQSIKGAIVLNLIHDLENEQVEIEVVNGDTTIWYNYTDTNSTSEADSTFAEASEIIQADASYTVTLEKNADAKIVAVKFTEE